MPAGQVLIYPVIDPSFDTESYRSVRDRIRQHVGRDAVVSGGSTSTATAAVTGVSGRTGAGRIARGPAARGRRDRRVRCAAQRGRSYAQRLRAANVPVVHRDYPGLFHGFVTIMPFAAGAAARELLWADMRRLLAVAVKASA